VVVSSALRLFALAAGFCTLAFAAGVAGDLARAEARPRSGQSVVVRIPPELPPDTPRARPLPPLNRGGGADAAELP
jgi:hypothetical protein